MYTIYYIASNIIKVQYFGTLGECRQGEPKYDEMFLSLGHAFLWPLMSTYVDIFV